MKQQSRTTTTTARQVLTDAQVMAPHSIEAEEAVLGSGLIDPGVLEQVGQVLRPSDFFVVKNQWVFEVMLGLAREGHGVDLLTVCEELERRGQLAEVGGRGFISHLIGVVPTSIHAMGYAKLVHDCSVRRRMLEYASDVAREAYEEGGDIFSAVGKLRAGGTAIFEAATMGQAVAVESADEILDGEYAEPTWLVPGMLPAGLTFLAGKPKGGKSWLALQLSCAVAAGGQVFGLQVVQGRVLYLALEDSHRRINNRMKKQAWPRGLPVDFITMNTFEQQIGGLMSGGAERVAYLIEKWGYRLVVVDTFGRALGMYLKAGDVSDYSMMVKALSPIQEMAQAKDCAVVVIDHHRKGDGSEEIDPMADLIGSIGKGATVDTMWGLYRKRGQLGAQLSVVGRDLDEEKLLALTFDKEFGIWICQGDANEIEMTSRRQEILDAIDQLGKAGIGEIAELTGQDRGNVHRRLQDLTVSGKVRRIQEGKSIIYEVLTV